MSLQGWVSVDRGLRVPLVGVESVNMILTLSRKCGVLTESRDGLRHILG